MNDWECPYCGKEKIGKSDDHIFPEFLGGKREIQTCGRTKCNNKFGNKFEREADNFLRKTQLMLAATGIKFKKPTKMWDRAFTENGKLYSLRMTEQGLESVSSSLYREEKDENGFIWVETGGPSIEDDINEIEKRIADKNKKGGNYELIALSESNSTNIRQQQQGMGSELSTLALKMSLSMSTKLPSFHSEEIRLGVELMRAAGDDEPSNVWPTFEIYEEIEKYRTPLSHLIYVERNTNCIYGLVQLFGFFQYFSRIGFANKNACPAAIVGVLDPISGIETEPQEAPLLAIDGVPPTEASVDHIQAQTQWLHKIQDEARACGADYTIDQWQLIFE